MTAPAPCCDSPLHGELKARRDTVDALSEEVTATLRPSMKDARALTSAERERYTATTDKLTEELAKSRATARALEEHHERVSAPFRTPPGQSMPLTLEQVFGAEAMKGTTRDVFGRAIDRGWSAKAMEKMSARSGDPFATAAKSLAAPGSVLTDSVFDPVPIREGERPIAVRQLIPVERIAVNTFGYLRQTARVNRAAPVAPGRLKPTSTYSLERVEDRCRVLAHMSEPVSRMDIDDSAALAQFLDLELRAGLMQAAEDQLVNGTGVGEDLTGFLATPGTTAQAWAGDLLATTRRAITTQTQLGNAPSAWVLAAADWERLELLRENGESGALMLSTGPVDRAAQRLWSLPVVSSDTLPAGTAILGDFAGSARLYQREEAQLAWTDATYRPAADGDPASSAFERNQLVVRCEERLGMAITRPAAFTVVDLTAP